MVKVQGSGVAYPVGSEKHQAVPEPSFSEASGTVPGMLPLGPVDVPEASGLTEIRLELRERDLVGMAVRALSLDPKNRPIVNLIDGKEFSNVVLEVQPDGNLVVLVEFVHE